MDRTLLEIFTTEQGEHVQRIRALVDALASASAETSSPIYDELLRRAHTLKGASRAVGLELTERVLHRIESVFAEWRRKAAVPEQTSRAAIHRALDGVEDILAWALGNRSKPDEESLMRALEMERGRDSQSDSVVSGHDAAATIQAEEVPRPAEAPPMEVVRVSTTLLDDVVRSAAELMHAAFVDEHVSGRIRKQAEDMEHTLATYSDLRRRCGPYLRQNAADPLLRPVIECLEFTDRQLKRLAIDVRRTATLYDRYNLTLRLRVEEVHDRACRARMTPAQSVFGVFGAMVRDLASEAGKQIEFRADGLDVQADREVLQAIKDPVMHILRNAVSHGIELPEERMRAGKPAAGSIRLRVESRGDRLLVIVQDDGKGLDTAALGEQALQQGLMTEEALRNAPAEAVARLIFHPGVTTSSSVTNISGRGMGLSSVAQTIASMHGDVRVQQRPGRGVRISISVPMSISTQDVVLLKEGDQVFGIPAASVDRLHRFAPSAVQVIDGVQSIVIDETPVPLVRLSELLALPESLTNDEKTNGRSMYQAVILGSGEERAAVVVEAILDQRETLVKDSGLRETDGGWSAGAVALEDGSVAVMISAGRLIHGSGGVRASTTTRFLPEPAEKKRCRILVVDDSVTTRAMERSLLEAHGYEVRLAVDGLEAWHAIQEDPPDLVISDVAMPRMDGFELVAKIKADRSTAAIPVILVTSLESPEEQEKGLTLGADAYIVKRKFDQRELLRIVRQIV